jgi:putative DNA methylase
LAEVDFPIAEVSRHAVREKSIRHGHPSTLHLWWARRPLASSRAVLLGLLLPDPCHPLCPSDFKEQARKHLRQVGGYKPGTTDVELRKALLKFVGDFASWDLSSNRTYLEVSRMLVKAAHGEEAPLVVDPFAGGGSIPIEALRLGCEVFASDLNPVACLILKVMLEDIPRLGPELADNVRRVGTEIAQQAAKELAAFYPKDPDGATPIAYLWARTVRCESPKCGAEIPLMRSLWLCKKPTRRKALRHRISEPDRGPPRVEFEIFEPKGEKDVPGGTVTRARATCVACGMVLAPERVRAQLAAQHGGADVVFDPTGRRTSGARMTAVVTIKASEPGRQYRLPTDRDYAAVRNAQEFVTNTVDDWRRGGQQGPCPVPDEPLPPIGTLGFRVQRYGMLQWGDLFSARQKVALLRFGDLVGRQSDVIRPLSLALGKLADLANAICPWEPIAECPRNVLSNGRIKPAWDFAEGVPISDASGGFATCLQNLAAGIESVRGVSRVGQSELAAAQVSPLPTDSGDVWFTDPPYYDAIPYSDLSDFFYVWYRRAIPGELRSDPFDSTNPLTPKQAEAVQDETKQDNGKPKDRAWFEETMALAFAEGRRVLKEDGIGAVVFAHKTTEGWEALLSGMIRGGWTITGSWPIATEMGSRLRARESAALATSVHLISRPRANNVPVGDWADVLRELPDRVGDWMERLQGEGVRGADLVFACVGPALEIFSRYSRVETADGREVALAEYLPKVWEVVGRSALAQVLGTAEAKARNGSVGAVEEDARLTALFLWTLQSTNNEPTETTSDEGEEEESADDEEDEVGSSGRKAKGFTLVFDVVRRFAQPLGIELPRWEGRVIEIRKGIVRLLPIAERAKQLFGDDGAQAVAARLERDSVVNTNPLQGLLFPDAEVGLKVQKGSGRGARAVGVSDESLAAAGEATTLDRIHVSMLLQAGGRTNALRALLRAEQERGPDFLRLANALSALYPKGSEEKRLLDAMLLAVRR